jgi:branched-chain amino acid transport system substrate-binding protein
MPMKNTTLFLLVLVLSGCGTTPAPPPIYLGHVAATSGPNQAIGQHEMQGIRLAMEDLTRAGQNLIGNSPVVVKHTDTRGDLDAFEGEAVRLASVSKVLALYGGNTGEEVLRLARGRVPLVTPLGYRPHGAGELVFSTGMSVSFQAKALARFAVEEKNIGKIVILVDETREQARAMADAFENQFEKVFAEKHPKEEAQKPKRLLFGKELKIAELAARPMDAKETQCVMFAGSADDFAQWRKAQPPGDFLILYVGEDSALRDAPLNTYMASAFATQKELPKTMDFVRRYREAFKEEPDVHAALAYDAVRILVEALQRSQKPATEGLAEELRQTKDFAGLTGPLSFGSDQQIRRPVFVGRVIGGKFEGVKRYDGS